MWDLIVSVPDHCLYLFTLQHRNAETSSQSFRLIFPVTHSITHSNRNIFNQSQVLQLVPRH